MEQAEGKLKQGMLEFKVKKIVHPSPFTHHASSKQGSKKIQEDEDKSSGENPIEEAVLLGVSTPEGTIPRKIRIKGGIVLPKRGAKIKIRKLQETILGKNKDDTHKFNDCKLQGSVPVWPRAPNADDIKLPYKYALLEEFLNCIVTSVRLLRLRKEMCTFTNIQSRVEQMTNRQFTHSHLAQIKHILDEAMVLEKVSTLDKYSACVRRDLMVTLTPNALRSDTEGQTGVVSFPDLKKIFHTRLVQFANSHPECEDIPEAPLPEPFNKKPLLESLSLSLEKFESLITATAVNSSVPLLEHNRIFQRISGHKNAWISPTIGSHLPQTFKRHFSQSHLPTQICQCNVIPEPVYSTGVRVFPCSVIDQLDKANEQTIFKQSKQEEGQDKPEISQNAHGLRGSNELQSNFSAEALLSIETPVSISSFVHESGHNVCDDALSKTPSQAKVLSSDCSTPFYTCPSKMPLVDCVFPLPCSLDSTVFATHASDFSFVNEASFVNSSTRSQLVTPIIPKALQHNNESVLPEPEPFSFGSPVTPIYYTPIPTTVDLSSVHESNDLHGMKSVASPFFSSPVIRQAGQSDFDDPLHDDLRDAQSSISLNPHYLAISSALSTPPNLFAFPRKWKEISLKSPFKSPVARFGSQKTQLETNLSKKKFHISHFHTPKHCKSGTGLSTIAEEKMLEGSICSQALSLLSPRRIAVEEVCMAELESKLEAPQHVQQQGEEEGAKVEGFYKEGFGEITCKIIKCPPARCVGLAWRPLSDLLLAWCDWLCNTR